MRRDDCKFINPNNRETTMSKYIDGTRVVYFDNSNGDLTIHGIFVPGNLAPSSMTVAEDTAGTNAGNFVHYDTVQRLLVYNQIGGGGGGGTSGTIVASTVTTTLDVIASGHLLGQETSQIVDYDFSQFGQLWNPTFAVGSMRGVAVSATGKYMILSRTSGGLAVSRDYGRSLYATVGTSPFLLPAISASGQYIYAGNSAGGGHIEASSDYGATLSILAASPPYGWNSVSCSADGRYVIAGPNTAQYPQLSSDFGSTWAPLLALPQATACTGLSATGQYMVVGSSTGSLYVSRDFGASWGEPSVQPPELTANWTAVAVSGNGAYMTVGGTMSEDGSFRLYYSRDYGSTWTFYTSDPPFAAPLTQIGIDFSGLYQVVAAQTVLTLNAFQGDVVNVGLNNNYGVAVSANGQYAVAGESGTGSAYVASIPTLFPAGVKGTALGPLVLVSSVTATNDVTAHHVFGQETIQTVDYNFTTFAQNWTAVTIPVDPFYGGAFLSATGKYQIQARTNIGGFYSGMLISRDYGASFTPVLPGVPMFHPAISASGQYIYVGSSAAAGKIFASSDYGVTFAPLPASPPLGYNSIGCSSDGRYILAGSVTLEYAQLSTDFGTTWSPISLGENYKSNLTFAAVSGTGQYMLLGFYTANAQLGRLYISGTFGVSWNQVGPTLVDYTSAAISGDGQYMLAAYTVVSPSYAVGLYRSSNYGQTWVNTNLVPVQLWSQLSIDYSGQYQVGSYFNEGVYYSKDFGVTWALILVGANRLPGIGLSANAQYMLTADSAGFGGTGYIYASSVPASFPGITTIGSIGANCNAPGYTLDVNGLAHQSNNTTSWYVASDRRIKTDIVDANRMICMSSIKALPLRYYQYDSNLFPDRDDKHVIGCVAQEVQPLFPKAVSVTSNYGISDLMGLDYDQIYKANVGATQYLGDLVEAQSTQIATLLNQVNTMNDLSSYIPSMMSTLKGLPPSSS